jgi:iron complex transport system substrate-binding protein
VQFSLASGGRGVRVRAAVLTLALTMALGLACRDHARSGAGPGARVQDPTTSARHADDSGAVVVDDFGDTLVTSGHAPRRIVSLNPATTEMVFAMGDGDRVVGRTRWDTYPPAALVVTDVGDGLRPNIEAVLATHPDLVVLYATTDDRDAARRFRAAGIATLSVRNDRMVDFRRVLRLIGAALHDRPRATALADSVDRSLAATRARTMPLAPVTVVWQIESAPLRVIGGGSYLTDLLADAGGRNVYGATSDPSPQVSLEDVLQRGPAVVLTTTVAAQALRADPRWHRWLSDPTHRVLVPDTALVGMPSVRMGEAAAELARLLHPDVVR